MEMKQIAPFLNAVVPEILGETVVVEEDLSNIADIGTQIFNANQFDHYVRKLINQVGRMKFVSRPYSGRAPSVLMESWEYGSIMEKISSEMPIAVENESWELVDGTSYDPNIFHAPAAEVKFFNKRTTFEIDRSITERQVKESFQSAGQLNSFISMLFNEVEKALTVKTDSLIQRTINNMIAETLKDGNGNRAVNLLPLYNARYGTTLSADKAPTTPEFIRFATYILGLYMDRLSVMSTLFNIGGKQRFTPRDLTHVVMLSEFAAAADVFLQSNTFHDNYTKLVNAERVPYWQGSGTTFAYADTSKINVVPASGGSAIEQSGILAIMFDHEALGVTHFDKRVTTNYNPKGEFTNYFYKQDAGYFNDTNENFVVFYAA